MRVLFTFISLLQLALLGASGVLGSAVKRDSTDPFFSPPKGWKSKSPGDVLRWRKIQPKFLDSNFNVAAAYQVLYRTSQNTPDEPQHTVTTILVPYNAKKNALVVGATAQDSNGPQCTPSAGYTYETLNFVLILDQTFFQQYLEEGYIMTIPDKEGPKNAFAAGRMEGYMTLDAVRATLNFDRLNLSNDTRVAGYGYSGGAITIGWAASLRPSYAPDINMIGWALGGTPSNLSGTINHIDSTIFSGLILAGVTGVSDVYPKVRAYLKNVLNSAGRAALEFCRQNCLQDIILKYPLRSIYSNEFQTRGENVFDNSAVQEMFTELTMGLRSSETPDVPTYMYHAEHDEIVPYDDAHKTARAWCRNGAPLHFTTYSHYEMGHFSTEITGSVPAFEFIRDRFNGKRKFSSCKMITEDTLFFNPSVLGGVAGEVIDDILDVFGAGIGPEAQVLATKKTIKLDASSRLTSSNSSNALTYEKAKHLKSALGNRHSVKH
ncbi:hypothetical protein MPSI1_003945 [Malassezia psittaci]|uniref:triacylglycerol lipase n=1 Tax=Malassezia psittaci TaxID=1821823 RepID=A0AAF0FIV9_9BASI|nr:hypothetical protein MPSI1_003945 [Malassezia psittaci]